MRKRLLNILLTACLLVGLLPTVALAVNNVSYLDAKGKSQTQNNVTTVTSSDTGWGTSGQTKWYVVNSNVTISGVTVSGNVHLILADGCTLTVNGSIKVEGSDTLAIYGQPGGSGTLNVNTTDDYNAGIGGGYTTSTISTSLGGTQTVRMGTNSGAITINGGRVTATSKHGAAIGGGGGGTSTQGGAGTVTINGGTVTATSTGWGAAIGGGGSPAQGGAATVTINGGIVTAEATASGTNQATKGYAAAIGSGTNASANVTIKGGIVSAFAKGLGADIGTGATLTGVPPITSSGTESASITGGVIFRGDEGKVYGDTKLAGDLTIASPKTLETPGGKALTIPAGKTLTLKSSITNSGSIYVDGTLTGTNYVTGNIYYPLTLVGCTATGTTTHNGARYCKPNTSVTLSASPDPGQTYTWKTTPDTTVVNMFTNSFTMPNSALTVEAVYTQAVSITTQPSNQTISYGNDVDLTVVAKNADGKTNGIAYQWYRVEGVTWVKLTDMTDSTLTLTKPNVGTYQYFCRVSCDGTSISSNTVTVTVTQASNTVTITGDPGKTYDGQLAVLTAELYTAIGDGAVTVAYKVKGAADSTYTGTAPANAGDYTVRVTQAATTNCAESSATKDFTISPKPVTVSGITAQDKTYDGTLTAGLVCTNAEFAGKLESDTLTVTATGAFSDKDVGPDKTVNITNLTLDGASKANYTLANEGQQTTTASISPKAVTVTIQPKSSACGAAIAALTATDNGIVSGDTNVYILSTTATSSSPVGSYDITGEGASANYTFTFENGTGAYTIVPGDLNDAAVSLTGWTYGGEPNTPVVTGNAENADVSYQYKVKDADDSTYSDVLPTGAGDYTVKATIAASTNYNEKTVTGDFTIAPKVLTVTDLTATDRDYVSGNISVELSGGTLDGIVGNDDVTAAMPSTGTITNADAGENKPVTFGEITLTGSNASNYTLTQPTVTVNISKVDPNVGEVSYAGGTIYTTTPLNSITLSKTGSALGELRLTDNQTLTAGTADYGWTFTPTDTTNYKTVTGQIELEIVEDTLASISIGSTTPTKTSYKYGEAFETNGLTVTATYASSATRDVTAEVTFGALAVGQTEITLSYQGETCTVSRLTVNKADARTLTEIPVSQKYTMTTGEKAIGTAGMPSDTDIMSYAKGTVTTTGSVSVTDWNVDATGKVTYTLSGAAAGDTVTLPVVIASTNYENSTVNVKITLTDKDTPTATANDITVTYTGSAVPVSAITGTASVAGIWSFKAAAPVNVADSSDSVTVVFIPDDEMNYEAVEDTIKVTINKATPTGTPTYTAITASGKTLADAALTVGSIAPTGGSIAWDLGDSQTVSANTAYNWTYTPADTDNYNHLTGSITPYVVSSSGGGGGGGVSTYAITVGSTKNGTVTVDPKTAVKGTTVTLTVKPDKGYTLDTLTVTDGSGKEVKLTEKNGKYTFTMPASKITVKVTFMEDNTMLNFFVDVPANAYYYDAVLWAAENGITGGVDDTHFAPNAPCTRAQAVTFLWRAAGCPTPKSSEMPFKDVPKGSYYETAVKWAVENGITNGMSDTTFSPDTTCSRAQIVSFLWRSQKSVAPDSVNPFTDVAADAYYANAVLWAAENGITGGTTATTFSPNNDCTRAQIVTFLFRCLCGE